MKVHAEQYFCTKVRANRNYPIKIRSRVLNTYLNLSRSDINFIKHIESKMSAITNSPTSVMETMNFNTPARNNRTVLTRNSPMYREPVNNRDKIVKLEIIMELAMDLMDKAVELMNDLKQDEEEEI